MSTLDALTDFVATANAGDLPAGERTILRRHTADVVAARVAGAACSEGKAVAAFFPPGDGIEAVAGLATLVRLTETDDIHTPSGTTPSSVAVPVALALAAEAPCSAGQLESAIHVGLETTVRLGMAVGGAKVLYQGLWPTRTCATLGAAATAARVWGLGRDETRNALSLAVMLTAGRTGRFSGEPSGRWILFAHAVASGVRAARAARAGFKGDLTVLDGDWLALSLGLPVDLGVLVGNLGRTSVLTQLSLKPYCTARQALPGAEAMRALAAQGLDPAAIESFMIKAPAAYVGMISQKLDPAIRSSAFTSGPGNVAIAALDPGSLYDIERTRALHDPRIAALAAKGTVVADPDLDALYPSRWPARLEVRTANATLFHEVLEPLGDPANPISDDALAEKARNVLGHVGRAADVAPLLAATRDPFASDTSATALARYFARGSAIR
jgi:2-methylcitrate dehydratase PrpD